MKYFWIPALVSIGLAVVVLLGEDAVVFYGAAAGFIAVLVTVAGALTCIKAARNTDVDMAGGKRIKPALAWAAAVGAATILLGYVPLCLTVLGRAREQAKSYITDGNLLEIGESLRLYVDEHGDYPPTFVELVGGEFDGRAEPELSSSGDDAYNYDTSFDARNYSSFVYTPGAGAWLANPRLILAYDREAWTPLGLRVFPRYGRCVLFADDRVDRLDEKAFRTALEKDAAVRREIGWPVPKPN